jgi:hypothetical protein
MITGSDQQRSLGGRLARGNPLEHLVRFTTTEGRDAQHVAPSLDDALRFVERLRNNEETNSVRLYRMQEVPVAFKTYYRAEVAPVEPADTAAESSETAAGVHTVAKPGDARPGVAVGAGGPAEVESVEQQARKLFSRG